MIAFPLDEPERTEDGWRIGALVPADTEYVRGHFPGSPLLPAVAQLALLSQAASACWRRAVALAGIVDLRFRGRVEPGDRLAVRLLSAEPSEELRFRLEREGELVSQGIVRVALERPE